jgi:hypothetical protein
MRINFERYGDIYRTTIYGDDVYVINSPQYVSHVLLRNWRNHIRRSQHVKRIALSLGNGLISSNGETWSGSADTSSLPSRAKQSAVSGNPSGSRWHRCAIDGRTLLGAAQVSM